VTSPPATERPAGATTDLAPASARPTWMPVWSETSFLRAVRATLVIPGLFAFADQVVGNVQMATFASFGGFATLVLSTFGGTPSDKARAHLGLAFTGTVLVVIGTLISSSTALAALVTVPVAFSILFAGVLGPNAASGAMGALLAFVLPVVSPGNAGMIPDRLAGWWLASVAGTAAVLLLSPRPPADRLHGAGVALASSLADELDAALVAMAAPVDAQLRQRSLARKDEMRAAFTATPYRPTGLATPDQAFANLVELLDWSCALVGEAVATRPGLGAGRSEDRTLVAASSGLLRAVAGLLRGQAENPDLEGVEHLLGSAANRARDQFIATTSDAADAHLTFHVRNLAVAARAAATDALIAGRQADDTTIAMARRRWYGAPATSHQEGRLSRMLSAGTVAARHASLRSVWYINSLRGALAMAAAVAVADLTDVQHGFWVVLGTLSVLRTNAASTGATALRALVGTVAGFIIGSALVIVIGSNSGVLWAVLPIAVFVAAYSPGAAPFAAGQAAFTVLVAVLFNLIVPAGWRVGVVRVEDVALGCGVSLVVGLLLWPRGAAAVVGDDLADAFRQGSLYLSQSVDWVLGRSTTHPSAGVASVSAGLRLDDALRGLLSEQGTKRIGKEHLWRLVGSTMRLRLTAHALAGTHPAGPGFDEARDALMAWSVALTGWYDRLATDLEGTTASDFANLEEALPSVPGLFGSTPIIGAPAGTLWVGEHLRDLRAHLTDVIGPAVEISAMRHVPWWR
jgi:hypothetical protein